MAGVQRLSWASPGLGGCCIGGGAGPSPAVKGAEESAPWGPDNAPLCPPGPRALALACGSAAAPLAGRLPSLARCGDARGVTARANLPWPPRAGSWLANSHREVIIAAAMPVDQ